MSSGVHAYSSWPRWMVRSWPYALYLPATRTSPEPSVGVPGRSRTSSWPATFACRPKPVSSTFSPSATVISANSGIAFFGRLLLRVVRVDDDHVGRRGLRLLAAARQLLQVDFASGIVTLPDSVMRSSLRTRSRSGVTMHVRAGNVGREQALAADLHVDRAARARVAVELQRAVARNDAAGQRKLRRATSAAHRSCPFFRCKPIAGMSAASSAAVTRPDELRLLHRAG